jgi:hypothetical protein
MQEKYLEMYDGAHDVSELQQNICLHVCEGFVDVL